MFSLACWVLWLRCDLDLWPLNIYIIAFAPWPIKNTTLTSMLNSDLCGDWMLVWTLCDHFIHWPIIFKTKITIVVSCAHDVWNYDLHPRSMLCMSTVAKTNWMSTHQTLMNPPPQQLLLPLILISVPFTCPRIPPPLHLSPSSFPRPLRLLEKHTIDEHPLATSWKLWLVQTWRMRLLTEKVVKQFLLYSYHFILFCFSYTQWSLFFYTQQSRLIPTHWLSFQRRLTNVNIVLIKELETLISVSAWALK